MSKLFSFIISIAFVAHAFSLDNSACLNVKPTVLTNCGLPVYSTAIFADKYNKTCLAFLPSENFPQVWQEHNTTWTHVSTLMPQNLTTWSLAEAYDTQTNQATLLLSGTDKFNETYPPYSNGNFSVWEQHDQTNWNQVSQWGYPHIMAIYPIAGFTPPSGNFTIAAQLMWPGKVALLNFNSKSNDWEISAYIPTYSPSLPFITPDGRQFFAAWTFAQNSNTVLETNIWEYKNNNWQLDTTFKYQNTGLIQAFAYGVSNNTPLLIAGSEYGFIKLWEYSNGNWTSAGEFKAHEGGISSLVTFAHDNQLYIVSGSVDTTIAFWKQEANEWKCFARLCTVDNGNVCSLKMSPDIFLVSGHETGQVCLWDIKSII